MPSSAEDTAELKRLTSLLVNVLNIQDLDYSSNDGKELLSHIAPDFEGRFDNRPHTVDFLGQTEIWRQDRREHPFLHFTVLDMTTHLRRRSQTASVYLKLALNGVGDVQFQGACELKWRDCGERWVLYHHVTMRGPLLDIVP